MQFRCIALIAVWTCISGPIFAPISLAPSSRPVGVTPTQHVSHASTVAPR